MPMLQGSFVMEPDMMQVCLYYVSLSLDNDQHIQLLRQ